LLFLIGVLTTKIELFLTENVNRLNGRFESLQKAIFMSTENAYNFSNIRSRSHFLCSKT